MMAFVIALSMLWYLHFGASVGVAQRLALQHNGTKIALAKQDPAAIIKRMREHLRVRPSGEGWFLLGKLYLHQGQLPLAQQALAEANKLRPQHMQTQLLYAQSLFFQQRKLNGQAHALLTQVLKQQPDHPVAINFLAMDAYQQQHYAQAVSYWEKLLPLYAADSADGKMLLKAIAKAQRRLIDKHAVNGREINSQAPFLSS